MDQQKIVSLVSEDIKPYLQGDSGHDWWHMYRVANLALYIAKQEGADLFVVQLGAWLHDIADWKFHEGDEQLGPKLATEILRNYHVEQNVIDQVCDIIQTISFKGAGVKTPMKTLEGKIVQDADRLDAIGAIGIARTFTYGGFKNNPIHTPEQEAVLHQSSDEYKKSQGSVINHFYEKLLLLKNRMNTQVGKQIAQQRHEFMQQFLQQFFAEWDGKDYQNIVINNHKIFAKQL